jgi:hypothetical protein
MSVKKGKDFDMPMPSDEGMRRERARRPRVDPLRGRLKECEIRVDFNVRANCHSIRPHLEILN